MRSRIQGDEITPDSIRTRPPCRSSGPSTARISPAQGRQWAVRRDRQTAFVHLRTIRLRGFKSFVEPLELKLEPGVAVVVGPNGSGKSNVADAIVWAAGSLTPSELRAEKPDDVLFGRLVDPTAGRPLRGRARLRQRGRRLRRRGRLQRDRDHAPPRPRRRGPVPRQQGPGSPHRPRRAVGGRRARRLDALDRLAGQGRRRAGLEARRSPPPRRGGGGARQVQAPEASRGAQARPRRHPGRARPRRRGRGAQAPQASCAAGDCRRAGREARTRDHRPEGTDRRARSRRRRRSPCGCRSPTRRLRDRPPKRSGKTDRTARGAPTGGGRAVGCRRRPGSGSCCALPASGCERAPGVASRVRCRAGSTTAQRSHGGRARSR